ncbi:MAG: 3-phosphoshikimate 1-carboxyvinyltransferase [Kiritimatiellae bacterium]|jgi:3-phosphoshikimate 1-carboxyvinyltransferase|nr:3-phosphoshikimate 1-carboxyvinyltransferase [Kiritimatiellia bacterium]MDD4340809.1 3-phosphoshikimate 1-carboxyvinyltransferase [Kiritimatiellia bacterium]MDY0150513.1 3-phosphoshikimate 1-carboxyvinyltransferase [Kiritimatiellia bacterium]
MTVQKQTKIVHPGGFTGGVVCVPGDKSISHRTALLAGLSAGTSEISGFLQAEDCLNTLKAMESFGARSWIDDEGMLSVQGTGGKMIEPVGPLDVGNSGTGMRLLAGLCAGSPIQVTLTGDESLLSRPMGRIQEPLQQMGARVDLTPQGTAPMTIQGGQLHGIEYRLPTASAQVKSCCILAGLYATGRTTVLEPIPTRDHTERMLRAVGAPIRVEGQFISVEGYGPQGPKFLARPYVVPGDFSSAAYWLAAAAAIPGVQVRAEGVGLNLRRTALLDVLRRMGAQVEIERTSAPTDPEVYGNVTVTGAALNGTEVSGDEIPNLIDELPLVAVLGALARGRTEIRDAGELRVKESDRVAVMAENLANMGVQVAERPDGMVVEGSATVAPVKSIRSYGDHRIAMSMSVLAIFSAEPVCIGNVACVDTSYPDFWKQLSTLGVKVE